MLQSASEQVYAQKLWRVIGTELLLLPSDSLE